MYASASAWAVVPSSEDVYGWLGLHQTSVLMPSPVSPSASTEDGKSSALPTDAIFGLKPCCVACFQKLVKSGGIGTPVMISTPALLNWAICAEKSSVPSG